MRGMARSPFEDLVEKMRARGIDFDRGLTDREVQATEARFGFRFPEDLRALLQIALPKGRGFPDWRSGNESFLGEWLATPREGVLFDIEHNGFWLEEWGEPPGTLDEAKGIASRLIAQAPRLVPVYVHRMIPDDPHDAGNPVFSVHQTDIIYYGFDLADYLRHEFRLGEREPWPERVRSIRFWDLDRFQSVRWKDGGCVFDNSKGILPSSTNVESPPPGDPK
jgi:hypothetical protein